MAHRVLAITFSAMTAVSTLGTGVVNVYATEASAAEDSINKDSFVIISEDADLEVFEEESVEGEADAEETVENDEETDDSETDTDSAAETSLEDINDDEASAEDAIETALIAEEIYESAAVTVESATEETLTEEEDIQTVGSDGSDQVGDTVVFSMTDSVTSYSLSGNTSGGMSVTTDETKGTILVNIASDGAYKLSGIAGKVYITVAKELSDVTLTLDGLTVDNSGLSQLLETDTPTIAIGKTSVVKLILSGDNSIIGDNEYVSEGEALIKAPASTLIIEGEGALTLTAPAGGGLSAKKGVINMVSGTLNIINTLDDGIKAKDENGTVNILGGTVNISECHDDGIQAENVNISDGVLNITTVYDNAATGYYTSGSGSTSLNTITENGSTKTETIMVDTGSHKGIKAGTKASTKNYADGTESSTTEASGGLNISGGIINIDTTGAGLKVNSLSTGGYTATSTGQYIIGSPDDAIQSNNDLSISGGTIDIASSDDGIGAAGKLTITGSSAISITKAYEGLEAGEIIIGESGATTGPVISLNTNDDGINASSKTVVYNYESTDNDETNYTKVSTSVSGNKCVIYSGSVSVYIDSNNVDDNNTVSLRNGSASSLKDISYNASGDGIDCNGTLDIEGGTVYVFGQSSGDNSPIDHDNGFTLSKNATLFAAGSSSMAGESIPGYGDSVYVTTGASQGGVPGGNDMPTPPGGNFSGSGTFANAPGSGMAFPGSDFGGETGQNMVSASFNAGDTLCVTNGSETVFSYGLPYAASFAIYSSPLLNSDTEYTITKGTASASSEDNTEISDDSDYASGRDAIVSSTEVETGSETSKIYSAQMVKGQTYTIGTGIWTSDNTKIATVAKKTGKVTAKKAGSVTLTDSANNRSYNITVYEPVLSDTKLSMLVGGSGSINISNTGTLPVTWISSDPSIISVSGDRYAVSYENGTAALCGITATGKGNATVTAYVGGKTYAARITVTDTLAPVALEDKEAVSLNVFQSYTPKFASGFKVNGATWAYDGQTLQLEKNLYTVNDNDGNKLLTITKAGKITVYKSGVYTLTGKDRSNKETELTLNASAIPTRTDIYLNAGQKISYKNTYVKSGNIKWVTEKETDLQTGSVELANSNRAAVSITGKAAGEITLICTYAGESYRTVIHIEDPALDLEASSSKSGATLIQPKSNSYYYTLKLQKGETFRIVQSGVDRSVNWSSSSAARVFASEYGILYARAKGTANISAKINNKTVKIKVTVIDN